MVFKKDKSVAMSAPEIRTLHGVQIKKMPNRKYLLMLSHTDGLILAVTTLFPDGVVAFSGIGRDGLLDLLANALEVIPEKLCEIFADLLDVPAEKLLDELTPVETLEILIALWEVNNLSDFFPNVRKLGSLIGLSAVNTGSSAG